MRQILIYLSGTVLLALAAYVIETRSTDDLTTFTKPTVPSNPRHPDEQAAHHSKLSTRGAAHHPRSADPKPTRKPSELTSTFQRLTPVSRSKKSTLSKSTSDGMEPNTLQQESSAGAARAFRLGSDVRLPAALMHQAMATATTPAIATASQGIIDSFYQEISTHARDGMAEEQVNSPQATNDDTRIVPAGPDADKARGRADETYRALYGNEAYNRHSINSALEVRLPELSE